FTDNAKSWFTGFNAEGTNNGWENTFHAAYQDQWNEALEKGTAREFFSQPNATGVVTWDHKGKNAKGETVDFKFGDVYENGEKKANVFDEKDGGFDRHTANMLMGVLTLDAETQRQANSDSDVTGRYDREVEKVRKDRNDNFENF